MLTVVSFTMDEMDPGRSVCRSALVNGWWLAMVSDLTVFAWGTSRREGGREGGLCNYCMRGATS